MLKTFKQDHALQTTEAPEKQQQKQKKKKTWDLSKQKFKDTEIETEIEASVNQNKFQIQNNSKNKKLKQNKIENKMSKKQKKKKKPNSTLTMKMLIAMKLNREELRNKAQRISSICKAIIKPDTRERYTHIYIDIMSMQLTLAWVMMNREYGLWIHWNV